MLNFKGAVCLFTYLFIYYLFVCLFVYLFVYLFSFFLQRTQFRGFIKGWQPGKLAGCQIDHAWLLLLLNQVVFLQESVNINNLFPPVKTEYPWPPVQNLNETPENYLELKGSLEILVL